MTLSVPVPLPPPTVSARMHAHVWSRVAIGVAPTKAYTASMVLISKPRAATMPRCRQRGSGGANRRSGFATWSGSQIGTSCHQPARTGTGTYSVVQPHQAGDVERPAG